MKFGILKEHKKILDGILLAYPYKFFVFGSRSKGDFRQNSDLDLIVFGDISFNEYATLNTQLIEASVPFNIDLVRANKSDTDFLESIKSQLVPFLENTFLERDVFDLTHIMIQDIPTWEGDCGFEIETTNTPVSSAYAFQVQKFNLNAGLGTHIDFPAHLIKNGKEGSSFNSKAFCAPCEVLHCDNVDENFVITKELIQSYENDNGPIQEGCYFLVNTGWHKLWNNPQKYRNQNSDGVINFPKLSEESAQYLLSKKIKGFGIDTLSPDGGDDNFPVHKLFLESEIYILENVDFPDGFDKKVGFIFVSPMLIKGATESPVRLFFS